MKTPLGRVILFLWLLHGSACNAITAESPARRADGAWVVGSTNRSVTLNPTNLAVSVEGEAAWQTLPSETGDLVVQTSQGIATLSLREAASAEVTPFITGFGEGLRVRLTGYRNGTEPLDLELRLSVLLERRSGEIVFEIVAAEGQTKIREVSWPRAFDPVQADRTIVPFMQGMMLPRQWPKKVFLYDSLSYGRGLYMPWWGQENGRSAVQCILETPDDGGCRFEHPAGGPTTIEPRWVHSLGKLGYPRRLRWCFFPKGNYVDMALRYRRHAIENGTLETLTEKFDRNPTARGLVGAAVLHTSILNHIQPESSYYQKDDPAANHQLTTFDQRAGDLRRLHAAGVRRVYLHLDGWGLRGYDNLHPDILPPSPEAGGWEGMRRFSETCEQLGYLFAVHDQYRDFYHDAASYREALTVIQEDGTRPFVQVWWGGKQSILCSRFAPGYVRRNHEELRAGGVRLKGSYLDVFAVVPGDECYSPDHPVTRSQSLRFRGEAFNVIRSLEGIVSSEEPADWAMRYLHLVHHGPFALDPNPGGGPAMGVPIPLHTLVYHDSIIVPWSLTKGGWGIPQDDDGFLHALANAGIPYVDLAPGPEHLERVRTVCALHHRLALQPMVWHEFVAGSLRQQKTTFSGGTTVTVDFETGRFAIEPPLTEAEMRTLSEPAWVAH